MPNALFFFDFYVNCFIFHFLFAVSIPSKYEKNYPKSVKVRHTRSFFLFDRAELLLGQDLGMDLLSDDDDQDGEEGDDDDAVIVPQKPPAGRASRPMSAYRRE
jgi:hypothetical protein